MSPDLQPATCIICSIFRREVEALQAEAPLEAGIRYLGSMLHMSPESLEQHLRVAIKEEQGSGRRIVLGYGDCCAHMLDFQQQEGVARTLGLNCCEIILGRERYRALRKEGVFFLLPEWASRWRAIFEVELGLTAENARSLMGEMHTRLVYLDTELTPVPETALEEASTFTGLPWEVVRVDLVHLRAALQAALQETDSHE